MNLIKRELCEQKRVNKKQKGLDKELQHNHNKY